MWLEKVTRSEAPVSTVLIRIMVGAVFLSEGIQKFLDPAVRGAGRFEKIGMPMPEFLSYFVGSFEVVCGALILLGLLTRLAAIPTFIIMAVAIITTKIPILLGHGFWGFNVRELSEYGFWSMAHAARTDFAMFLGSLYLIIVGAGACSVDYLLSKKEKNEE